MENEEENDMLCEWDPLLESDAPADTFISDSGSKKECSQPHDTSTDSKESSQTTSSKEGKTLLENGGEIGYQKGGVFISMTNFAVVCTGFVIGHENAKNAEGFLVNVIPKESVRTSEDTSSSSSTSTKR